MICQLIVLLCVQDHCSVKATLGGKDASGAREVTDHQPILTTQIAVEGLVANQCQPGDGVFAANLLRKPVLERINMELSRRKSLAPRPAALMPLS